VGDFCLTSGRRLSDLSLGTPGFALAWTAEGAVATWILPAAELWFYR